MDILGSNIIKTLVYSDLFDYPLNALEVCEFLIGDTEVKSTVVWERLKIFTDSKRIFRLRSGQVYTDGEFYFLKEREKIVELRKKKAEWSKEKWKIAQTVAEKLKIIPSIKMIGVTGALAMRNCKKDDDIDLLIISSCNSLWLTRLFLILVTLFFGINRRKPNEKNVNNKICFNLFLDESSLKIYPENLFLAHEIAQVKPIYGKDGIYDKFMKENEWVGKYLPNTIENSKIKTQKSKQKLKNQNFFLYLLNSVAFFLQYLHMKSKITNEKISLLQAFFHPNDLSGKIQKRFSERLIALGLDNKNN